MSFWRREVIEFALDHETRRQMEEQQQWIEREPWNPRPYYHLAQFYRMNGNQDAALGLLLESVRLDPSFADAHVSLAEIYAVRADYDAAWRHAREGEQNGNPRAVRLLSRYGLSRDTPR
jgi:cytochrome c-type biogenesis protein CcmH/NrfG